MKNKIWFKFKFKFKLLIKMGIIVDIIKDWFKSNIWLTQLRYNSGCCHTLLYVWSMYDVCSVMLNTNIYDVISSSEYISMCIKSQWTW